MSLVGGEPRESSSRTTYYNVNKINIAIWLFSVITRNVSVYFWRRNDSSSEFCTLFHQFNNWDNFPLSLTRKIEKSNVFSPFLKHVSNASEVPLNSYKIYTFFEVYEVDLVMYGRCVIYGWQCPRVPRITKFYRTDAMVENSQKIDKVIVNSSFRFVR